MSSESAYQSPQRHLLAGRWKGGNHDEDDGDDYSHKDTDDDNGDDDDEYIGVIGVCPSIRTQTPPGRADGKASGRGKGENLPLTKG